MLKYILLLLLVIAANTFNSAAQQDMRKEKQDSVSVYDELYEFSKHGNLSRFIYGLIFRVPEEENKDTAKVVQTMLAYDPETLQGKTIRNIIIISRSPFEVTDSVRFFTEENLDRFGNYIHVNTWPFVIRNLLLFKKHDTFDALTVRESERLIRRQRFVESSNILPVVIPGNDSIDIIVSVRDVFSIGVEGQLSRSKFGAGLSDVNFLGLGHQAHAFNAWDIGGGLRNYQYNYNIPNIINNSYINTRLLYARSINDSTFVKQIQVNRPFYSSLSKWAGGVSITQQSEHRIISFSELSAPVTRYMKYNMQDYWGAFAIGVGHREIARKNTRNIVFSGRYYRINYLERPLPEYDPDNLYATENLYLLGLSFSDRRYKKDRYLFRFGFTEDVPVGKMYELIGGIQRKNSKNRLYMAVRLSKGGYFKLGYLSGTLEYGSFLTKTNVEEGVFTAEVNYFSPLLKAGGWRFRQFIKPQLMIGINRLETERLYLNDYYGINGFDSNYVTGTRKFVCNFQTQIFAPWNIWGFKIGPYLACSLGVLGDDSGFFKNKIYTMYGLGFLIRNDWLIFNSFQFSVAYYPYVPGDGYDAFRFSALSASDFGLRDFEIQKPDKIIYK